MPEFNKLDNLENYTYHFRLFMINELSLKINDLDINKVPQITIAETGHSKFYIDEVEINNSLVMSPSSTNSVGISINMKIIEPYSMEFIDRIAMAANKLLIPNFAKSTLFLEVTFYSSKDMADHTFSERNEPRLYRLIGMSMDVSVDQGGSTYSITANGISELGTSETHGSLQTSISAKGSDLLELLHDFQVTLNASLKRTYNSSTRPLIQYEFVLCSDPNPPGPGSEFGIDWENLPKMSLLADKFKERQTSTEVNVADGNGKPVLTSMFKEGSKIQRIIEDMVGATKWADDIAVKIKEEIYEKNEQSSKKIVQKNNLRFIRIEPHVQYVDYDSLSNDFDKKITYFIYPYETFTANVMPISETTDKNLENKKANIVSKLASLEKRTAIKKEYRYIFSGKNLDILSFDLKYNMAWKMFLNANIGTPQNQHPQGPIQNVNPKITEYEQKVKNEIESLEKLKEVRNQLNAMKFEDQKKTEEGRKLLNEQRLLAKSLNIDLGENEQTANKAVFKKFTDTKKEEEVLEKQRVRNEASEKYNEQLKNLNVGKKLMAEDIKYKPMTLPISTNETSKLGTKNTDQSVSTQHYEGKNFFTNLMNMQYGGTGDMLKVNLEIRGDPYWLGESRFRREYEFYKLMQDGSKYNTVKGVKVVYSQSFINLIANRLKEQTGTFNPDYGDNLFLLEIIHPSGINYIDGREHTNSDLWSGLYQVTTVKSNFSQGRFVQTISAIRDPATASISYKDLKKLIDKSKEELKDVEAEQSEIFKLKARQSTVLTRANDQDNLTRSFNNITSNPNQEEQSNKRG